MQRADVLAQEPKRVANKEKQHPTRINDFENFSFGRINPSSSFPSL